MVQSVKDSANASNLYDSVALAKSVD